MATPNSIPKSRGSWMVRPVVAMADRHKRCADRGACKGPGCVVSTGKTSRKR